MSPPANQLRANLGSRCCALLLRHPHVLPAIAAVVVLLFYGWRWRTLAGFVVTIDNYEQFLQDFVSHYYPMARQILERPQPVAGYLYPSFFAVLLAPLGALELAVATVIWTVVQVLSVVGLYVASTRGLLRLSPVAAAGMVVLLLTAMPVLGNVKWGQVSVLVTACVLGAGALQQRGRSLWAGVLLGFATAIKLYPAAFAFCLLLRRDWRALGAFVATTLLCYVLVPGIAIGFGPWLAFERGVAATASVLDVAGNINSQFFPNVGLRWHYLCLDQQAGPAWIAAVKWLGYGLAAGCGVLAVLWHRRRPNDPALPLVCLLVALPLVVRTSWGHYFVYLPFCQVVLLARLWAAVRDPAATMRRRRLALVLCGLPVLSMLSASVFCLDALGGWVQFNGYGVLLIADLLLVAAVAGVLPLLKERE